MGLCRAGCGWAGRLRIGLGVGILRGEGPIMRYDRARLAVSVSDVSDWATGVGGRYTWCTNGAKENGIVLLELVEAAFRDVSARLLVDIARPVEVGEFEGERSVCSCQGVQDVYPRGDDFGAYAVAGYGGDFVDAVDGSYGARRHDRRVQESNWKTIGFF